MEQKLIMETWRRFLNESLSFEEIDMKYETQLEEGLGTTLLTLATFIVAGQTVELDKAEQTLAYEMMNKIELQGDTYSGVPVDEIRAELDAYMAAAQRADNDGDGVSDRAVKIQDKIQGQDADSIVGQLFQYVDGKGPTHQPPEDTGTDGDTGATSQQTLNVSVAINQMDLAQNNRDKEARNGWAKTILDYHESTGGNSGIPEGALMRAKFFLGK
tara:strand:- start:10 stop:654 length:645 start_codon:yes stop_codon:yes gene_type:complete